MFKQKSLEEAVADDDDEVVSAKNAHTLSPHGYCSINTLLLSLSRLPNNLHV